MIEHGDGALPGGGNPHREKPTGVKSDDGRRAAAAASDAAGLDGAGEAAARSIGPVGAGGVALGGNRGNEAGGAPSAAGNEPGGVVSGSAGGSDAGGVASGGGRRDGGRRGPRWLDPEEREAWLGLVRLLATLPAVLDAQLGRDAGLTFFEYSVLAMLSEQPARELRMSELARVTNSSLSRLSNVVKRLERRGLLHREPDPGDGRCTRAVLSESGFHTVVLAAPDHVEAVRNLVIDALTPAQMRDMLAAHERILANLDPDAATHPAHVR